MIKILLFLFLFASVHIMSWAFPFVVYLDRKGNVNGGEKGLKRGDVYKVVPLAKFKKPSLKTLQRFRLVRMDLTFFQAKALVARDEIEVDVLDHGSTYSKKIVMRRRKIKLDFLKIKDDMNDSESTSAIITKPDLL